MKLEENEHLYQDGAWGVHQRSVFEPLLFNLHINVY